MIQKFKFNPVPTIFGFSLGYWLIMLLMLTTIGHKDYMKTKFYIDILGYVIILIILLIFNYFREKKRYEISINKCDDINE